MLHTLSVYPGKLSVLSQTHSANQLPKYPTPHAPFSDPSDPTRWLLIGEVSMGTNILAPFNVSTRVRGLRGASL